MGDRDFLERILSGLEEPTDLKLTLLEEITDKFSENRKIGEGGFGEVYKGVLQNRFVAVKRITVTAHTVDDKSFHREVKNLMKIISHQNVVRFLGFCLNIRSVLIKEAGLEESFLAQKKERLLCFEYISNRSLDKHISDELRGLEWSVRYEIIKGICHGLHYLHEKNNIIHMDLKPANIMIDDDMVPKITDFGLSRLDKHTHTSGTRYITQGYCAPEYVNDGKTSKKGDMYSLGVIITELVTGCKGDPDNINVLRRWRHRWNNSPEHPLLSQDQQVTTCLHIAAQCRKKEPTDRPSISSITSILSEADSTNEHTHQISLYSDDMLGIKPLELWLPFELQKQISSIVNLINRTMDYYAFNIETPSRQYHTQPNKGIVSPKSTRTIQITMQAQETAPQDMPYTNDFIVQSTKVDGDLRAEDITKHMFNKEPGEVDEVNLMVVVYEPEEPMGDLKSQEDNKKRKKMVESAFSEDKPGVSATRQAEAIHMDINSISCKDAGGQCTEQPRCLSFQETPSISRNQQTKMSNRAVDLATGAMGSLRHKLGDLLKEEYNLEISVKMDIESLSQELREMQLALCKVSEVHRDYLKDEVKQWADCVREMSYDIEDVVDDFLVHVEHRSNTGFFMGLMQKMFNLFKLGKNYNPIGDAIQGIKVQVRYAADGHKKFKVDEVVANVAAAITMDPRISAIYKDQKELVGIKKQRNKLIKWLSDKNGDGDVSKQQLKIVSIVGFGGLGKTTLAKAVYDKLQSQFSLDAFVPVGRNPNVNKVFEEILHKLGYGSNASYLNEMQLIDEIRGFLKKKRYFIVIDDIWDSLAWDRIKCAFTVTEGNRGSSVVTTTRIRSVANNCCIHNREYVYEMKKLNDQDSRKLFVSRIFGSQEGFVPDEISNDILKKCGGLPLAIISIASLLAHDLKPRWDSVRNSLESAFEGNHDDLKYMEQVLDLSYMHLPHHLKTCLLDIGKYREDREIQKKDLLRQWTAQGFVSTTPGRDAEDVAEDNFYALINMSMIQPGRIDHNDEVLSCRVHDLMLDLIRSKAAKENFNLVIDGPEIVTLEHKRARRVSIQYSGEDDGGILAAINGPLSHVRSVLLFRRSLVPSFLVLKYIRVFHLEDSRCAWLDLTCICGLFLLRYLKIRCLKICRRQNLILPTQIGELRQLRTIEVEIGADDPTCLPSDIYTLPQLLHLSYQSGGVVLPDGIGRLKSLRTLRLVGLLESSVDNIKGLGELTNLRELEMCSRHRTDDDVDKLEGSMHIDALRSSIGKLSGNLRSLIIGENCNIKLRDHGWSSTLTPPLHLRKLDLSSFHFQRIPRWIAQLHKLDSLTLSVKEVADGVSIVSGLPSLAYFELYASRDASRDIIISGRGFGALKHLKLGCPSVLLVFQAGALPMLETLNMWFHTISAKCVPVGIEHLPAGTLRQISLRGGLSGDTLPRGIELLFREAFKLHHPSAVITIHTSHSEPCTHGQWWDQD